MGLLKYLHKKVKGSSLVEVLTATIIMMLVFTIAIITILNLVQSRVQNNGFYVNQQLQKQLYFYKNNKLSFPTTFENERVFIEMNQKNKNEFKETVFVARDKTNKKERIITIVE